jgi:DNA-binding GntR family transcriptional regulator
MIDYMEELIGNTNFNQNKSIRQIVYESLRKTIISGIIPVGERIMEKTCADRLNISRTPVREALRMLEMEELVEYVPGVGIIVKRISYEDVIEIFKIRRNLEILAATAAMDNITKEEIEDIKKLIDLAEVENKNGDTEVVKRLFGEFNQKIYVASGMKRLNSMVSRLNEYLERFRTISMCDYDKRKQAIREHREILRAIVEKNKKCVESIIEKHLENSFEVIVAEIIKDEEKAESIQLEIV